MVNLTPAQVYSIVMANGGWQGRLAKRANLYREKVRAWRKAGSIPDVWRINLHRFKAFREAST